MKNNLSLLKSIENRILFALMIIGFVPLAASFIFNNFIISNSLSKLENQNIHVLGNQTNMIIQEKLKELGMTVRDYAIWDDAYEKIEEKDRKWFGENFSGWIPENFDVDLSVVINTNNEVIDEYGLKENDAAQLLKISSIYEIMKSPYDVSPPMYAKGILMYDGSPYLFYASQILKSNYKGEPAGLFIIGKSISAKYIGEIEKLLGQKLFMTFGDRVVYSDTTSKNIDEFVKVNKKNGNEPFTDFVNNEIICSMPLDGVLNGYQGKLTIIAERDIFLQTKGTLNIGSGSIVVLALISILAAGLILKRYTTLPIKNFENQIYKMSQNNVVSYVDTEGPEEVQGLTNAFNLMVNKLNEQSIENQNLKSELEYDRLRSEFLTNVSHEFKTPLNVIFGAIQLIELFLKNDPEDNLGRNIKKHVSVMRQNCYRLLRLVNNLIDLTKIRSAAFKLHLKNHNIISLVEDITLSVAEYTEGMGIFVGFDTDTEEKIMACDPDQIERIILNLLSNSIKFTKPGGEIWVVIKDLGNRLSISVKDTGEGIPKDQLEIIFERFRQVDRSLTRNHEGSGIGLSLVKSLVEMHKGTIRVESEYGKGSEFIIELPVIQLPETKVALAEDTLTGQNKVERIHIEFSDIYSDR
ncbi:MAG: ATP-binding protein [Bacillota bacterium]|nr:ATP-binding protein [Bacillota bacterium]